MNKLYAYLRTINPWVLTVVGLAILLIISVAYVADQWSRQAAIERSERVVPDPGDPSTWNLPPLTDTTSRYPVDGVFDLMRENLASGAISLATFSFSDSGKDGFGYIRFRDGKADTCGTSKGGELVGKYIGLRTSRYTYVLYDADKEQELYDNSVDPHQLTNVALSADVSLLDTLRDWAADLSTCQGETCRSIEAENRLE